MKATGLEVLRCDAGWRDYYFLKLSTDGGITGWNEFDEGFGLPGITTVIERSSAKIRSWSNTRWPTTRDVRRALAAHPPKVVGGLTHYRQQS